MMTLDWATQELKNAGYVGVRASEDELCGGVERRNLDGLPVVPTRFWISWAGHKEGGWMLALFHGEAEPIIRLFFERIEDAVAVVKARVLLLH